MPVSDHPVMRSYASSCLKMTTHIIKGTKQVPEFVYLNMNLQKAKEKIIKLIEASDDEALLMHLQNIIDTNDDIAGYRPDGSALTYGMLRESIDASDVEFNAGEGMGSETLKQEVKKWRNN